MKTELNILENLKTILSRPFRIYDIKNIDLFLAISYWDSSIWFSVIKESTLKTMLGTKFKAFNIISIATWEGAKSSGSNEIYKF